MKNILIPTDFSACATNAMKAAFELSKHEKVLYYLFSQIDIPEDWMTMSEEQKKDNPEALQIVKNTEILFNGIREQYPDIPIKTFWSGGRLFHAIVSIVEQNNIDLVIMGSHGSSGVNELFIGSNTQKVVRQLRCPVLLVKEAIPASPFGKVIFASSFDANEKEGFLKFLELVRPYSPEIHLLSVHTSSLFDAPYIVTKDAMNDFKKMAEPLNCTVHIYRDYSVERGIAAFANDIDADVIAISNHHRSPLKRMVVGSNVETLVNHSKLPVLSIDF